MKLALLIAFVVILLASADAKKKKKHDHHGHGKKDKKDDECKYYKKKKHGHKHDHKHKHGKHNKYEKKESGVDEFLAKLKENMKERILDMKCGGKVYKPDNGCVDIEPRCEMYKDYCLTYPVLRYFCRKSCDCEPPCADAFDGCVEGKAKGYCIHITYMSFMKFFCKNTCNACPTAKPTTVRGCRDKPPVTPCFKEHKDYEECVRKRRGQSGISPFCLRVVNKDLCRVADFMRQCERSCGYCQPEGPLKARARGV